MGRSKNRTTGHQSIKSCGEDEGPARSPWTGARSSFRFSITRRRLSSPFQDRKTNSQRDSAGYNWNQHRRYAWEGRRVFCPREGERHSHARYSRPSAPPPHNHHRIPPPGRRRGAVEKAPGSGDVGVHVLEAQEGVPQRRSAPTAAHRSARGALKGGRGAVGMAIRSELGNSKFLIRVY